MKVIARVGEDGALVFSYLSGPNAREEAYRLGLSDAKFIRVRQQPDDYWSAGPVPPGLEDATREIPMAQRGRLGTIVRLGSSNNADLTAEVKLFPIVKGKAAEVVAVPLIWLERVEPRPRVTYDEVAHRRDLIRANVLRVRASPDVLASPEVLAAADDVPIELRGRTGTVVGEPVGSTCAIKLHRAVPGEERKIVEVPLVWLEPKEELPPE